MKKIFLTTVLLLFIFKLNAQEHSFMYNDIERTYLLYVPSTYDGSIPFPVIITLHGFGGTAELQARWWPNERADIMRYIAVFPNGVNNAWDEYATGYPDDVGFISALIDTLEFNYNVDPSRIYITGHSNGAYMSYTLATFLPDKITAIAPVEGLLFGGMVGHIAVPVPVMHIHAMDDNVVPYEGLPDYGFLGVDSIMSVWRGVNNCVTLADTLYNKQGILGIQWSSPSHNADVELYRYTTGGHMTIETPVNCTDFILDFFYNQPHRDINVKLADDLSDNYNAYSDLEINVLTESLDSIVKVEFFANLTKIGEDTSSPYSMMWHNIPYGDYYLNAKAITPGGSVVVTSNPKLVHITLPNVAFGKHSACSSVDADLSSDKAFDGDFLTRWSSKFSDPQWIVTDLRDYYKISEVSLFWEAASARSYRIMVSDDLVNWKEAYSTTNSDGYSEYVTFDTVEAKYVCMYGNTRTTPWGYSLWEFQVYGDPVSEFQESTIQTTVEGRFSKLKDPSTNDFRLVDSVSELNSNTGNYVLTLNGFWLTDDQITINNVTAEINDSIRVTGIVREKKDSAGHIIRELEVKDLELLSSTSSVKNRKADVNLLKQNYPNPFSDATIIEYNLHHSSSVDIIITDVTGKVVKIFSGGMKGPGHHELKFDGSRLPCGVYFYCIKTNDETETKRFIIAR